MARSDDAMKTPLYTACERGHHRVVAMLLQKGADLNKGAADPERTPLVVASGQGHTFVCRLLVKAGAVVCGPAIDAARAQGHADTVALLTRGSHRCARCGKTAREKGVPKLFWCLGCKRVSYCSRHCQKKHWVRGGHEEACDNSGARREAETEDWTEDASLYQVD